MEEKDAVWDRLAPLQALYQWNSVRRMENEEGHGDRYEGEDAAVGGGLYDNAGGEGTV